MIPAKIKDVLKDPAPQQEQEDAASLIQSYWARPESVHHDPDNEIPEKSMPARVAKHVVDDILQLNYNPRLNLASWLTTEAEEEMVGP